MTWPIVPLGKVTTIVSGSTPKTGKPEYWDGDILWATPKDLSDLDAKYISSTASRITQAGYDSCSTALLPANSVLLSSRAPIGLVAINTVPMATNQGFKSLVPDRSRLHADYLYYWLKSNKDLLNSKGRGATFKEINKKIVETIEIPLPPLDEQKRIAAVLDAADALRAKRRAALAKLDTLLQSVFLEMFGDPVTNPMGWEIQSLRRYFSSDKEGTKCGPFGSALKRSEYVDSGIPVWVMDNIDGMQFKPDGCLYIPESKYRQLHSYATSEGDIIISRAGTVGKMCVVETTEPRSIISTNLIRLSLDGESLDPYYFVALMSLFKGRIGRLQTGEDGSYSFMNTGILKKLKLPVPPMRLQWTFRQRLDSIRGEETRQSKSLGRLDDLFNSLQQHAFVGDLVPM